MDANYLVHHRQRYCFGINFCNYRAGISITNAFGCASDGGKQAHGARGEVGLGECLFCLTREGHKFERAAS